MTEAAASHPDRQPLLRSPGDLCDGCGACVRICPVRALRVVRDRVEIIPEKCVACGLCVRECSRGGHSVRDDLPAVEALLRSRTPVVALLSTEFIAALAPLTVVQIERALEALGFCAVETTVLGEEMVAESYEHLHGRDDTLVSIRSTCPVVTSFVRAYHPALAGALAPIVPPYVAQARLIRALYPEGVAIVYAGPCYARKDEVYEPQLAGVIDVAVDFTELRRLIDRHAASPSHTRLTAPPLQRPRVLKEVSLTDGFPRKTVAERQLSGCGVETVRGLAELERLLCAVEAGEVAPRIIDALSCEGCIDGPAVAPGLSLYAKRTIDASAREDRGATRVSTRALLEVLPSVDLRRSFDPDPVALVRPEDAEVDAVLAAGGIDREQAPDCGACGWATCVEHAVAIYRGDSTWDLCLPLQRSLLKDRSSRLEACETLDPLTGAWNRRSFADRLSLEHARHARYGTPLAVLALDVDGLGAVNDRLGEAAGDRVLREIASRLAREVRSTDLVARWGGDRFSVIVPGISKTAAFAVAEKLREAVSGATIPVESDGYTHDVSVTVSVGVAAAGSGAPDPGEMLEAADTALLQAIAAGGDQVRLAPG